MSGSPNIPDMPLGADAERGRYEPIPFKIFPAREADRTIKWRGQGQNSFSGGTIEIGQEKLSKEELAIDGSKPVPAGQSVLVGKMDVKFI
ncbi:hypothetical protein VTG60DRAFT_2822 [Thermothelomyces hinnuleus]